jgi:hypothetical protein
MFCLLPHLDTACEALKIPRIDNASIENIANGDLSKVIKLVPHFNKEQYSRLLLTANIDKINCLKGRLLMDYGSLEQIEKHNCKAWQVNDIENLCFAVTIADTSFWREIVEKLS